MAPQDRNRRSGNRTSKDSRATGQGTTGRDVTISKALSWLLRHGAAQERVAMDGQGYVRVEELLRWHKLKALGVGMEELVRVVEGSEKQRFALRWVGTGAGAAAGGKEVDYEDATVTTATTAESRDSEQPQPQPQPQTETETETETQRALQHAATDLEPSHYLIRATQGHSLKTLDASAYLTPITLADPQTLPETVVHGTFYAAWERILASGGLKPMGRVHVHFATGPRLEDVLVLGNGEARSDGVEVPSRAKKTDVVISGMRADAQILIYVDIRRALEAGVEFWRSENGVVLTEGMATDGGGSKMVTSEFWDVVVETKAGVGVLWRYGEGVVKELPAELKGKGMPSGKERVDRAPRGGRGKGNAKPKLRVERDDVERG